MIIEKTEIEGLIILIPKIYRDHRGYFSETFRAEKCDEICGVSFVQDNESRSHRSIVRALHFQRPPHAQDKLVRVVRGSVLDVAVDLRKDSPTYGKHVKVLLSEENRKQFFIPKGFAHGFVALEDHSIVQYKCSAYYHPGSEGILRWDDPDLAIDWRVKDPILSEKDARAQSFAEFDSPF